MAKPRIGFVGWAVVAFIGFIVLPLITYACWYAISWQRFESKMAELSESQPVSVAGMNEYYSIPDGVVDCTHLYLSVTKVMQSARFKADITGVAFIDVEDIPPTKRGEWKGTAFGRTFLDKYEPELQKLYQASELGGAARYPVKFEDGFLTLLSNTQNVHHLSRLLYLDAWVNAHEGNSAGVTRAIRAAYSTARSLEYEPILVSQIILMRKAEQTTDELEKLLSMVDFTDQELHSLQLEIRKFDLRAALRCGFVGEEGLAIISLADADQEQIREGKGDGTGVAEWMMSKLGSRFDDLLLYTDCNTGFVNATEKPWIQSIETVQEITTETREKTAGQFRELRYGLTRICLSVPSYPGNLFGIAAVQETKLKLIDVLLATKRYERDNGRLPNNIAELVPRFLDEVPIDPCDPTNTFDFSIIDGVVKVSSVGLPQGLIDVEESNFARPPDTGRISMKYRSARSAE